MRIVLRLIAIAMGCAWVIYCLSDVSLHNLGTTPLPDTTSGEVYTPASFHREPTNEATLFGIGLGVSAQSVMTQLQSSRVGAKRPDIYERTRYFGNKKVIRSIVWSSDTAYFSTAFDEKDNYQGVSDLYYQRRSAYSSDELTYISDQIDKAYGPWRGESVGILNADIWCVPVSGKNGSVRLDFLTLEPTGNIHLGLSKEASCAHLYNHAY